MGIADDQFSRVQGTVIDLDESLRVRTYRPAGHRDSPRSDGDAQGRFCFDLIALTDADTGRPCRESCPFSPENGGTGWSYGRALVTDGPEGERARVDCVLVKYLDPNGARSNLCITGLPAPQLADTHLRATRLIDAIHPVTSTRTDLESVLRLAVDLTLGATSAEGAELLLSDPEDGGLSARASRGLPAHAIGSLRKTIIGARFPDAFVHEQLPILGMGEGPEAGGQVYLALPLVAGGRLIGALGIVARRDGFDLASVIRVLFPLTAQLGVYLGTARQRAEDPDDRMGTAVTSESARLGIRCLGTFLVTLDDAPVSLTRFGRSKALTLLKFLAGRRGRPVPRDVLKEVLWPGADPVRSSGYLRVVLHALRRALEPELHRGEASSFVIAGGDLVSLVAPSMVWIDVDEFVDRARRAVRLSSSGRTTEAISEYRRAAGLYRGEYLDDELYIDWCHFDRERLKQVRIGLSVRIASMLTNMGDLAQASEVYRAALAVDSGREEIHRELMRLLWRSGQRDEALRQYASCRESLREELGVGPARETEELYAAIAAEGQPRSGDRVSNYFKAQPASTKR